MKIFAAKDCALYLRPSSFAEKVATFLQEAPNVQPITVPDIEVFENEAEAPIYAYSKTWEEGKDDPWLVFHTSGTTGLLFTRVFSD